MAMDPNHVIVSASGRFDETSRAQLSELFAAHARASVAGPRRMVLHFHGGLVSKKNGLEIAERLQATYAIGWPVFFVWESGLLETLRNNLGEIASEPIFKKLLARLVQWVVGKVRQELEGARGGIPELPDLGEVERALVQVGPAGGPLPYATLAPPLGMPEALSKAEESRFLADLEGDSVLREEVGLISTGQLAGPDPGTRGPGVVGARKTRMDPRVLEQLRAGAATGERGLIPISFVAKAAFKVLVRVVYRLARNRDHGIYCTVLEELLREFYLADAGGLLWRQMKKDTADAFGADGERCVGTAFLDELAKLPSVPPITLVGHSTGAVFISHFLDAAAARIPDAQFDIILLAPAATFELYERTLNAHAGRIANVRLFGMSDAVECDDAIPLYPRSLLYFVSGVVEDGASGDVPIIGMERYYTQSHYSQDAAVVAVRQAMAVRNRLVWSQVNRGPGLRSRSQHHGDFDNDPATLESLEHILANGF